MMAMIIILQSFPHSHMSHYRRVMVSGSKLPCRKSSSDAHARALQRQWKGSAIIVVTAYRFRFPKIALPVSPMNLQPCCRGKEKSQLEGGASNPSLPHTTRKGEHTHTHTQSEGAVDMCHLHTTRQTTPPTKGGSEAGCERGKRGTLL